MKTLTNIAQSTLEEHYKLLKFCDELSLYACMNEPGVKKNEEIDLFKEGFEGMEIYNRYSDSPIIAEWIDEKRFELHHFLLQRNLKPM